MLARWFILRLVWTMLLLRHYLPWRPSHPAVIGPLRVEGDHRPTKVFRTALRATARALLPLTLQIRLQYAPLSPEFLSRELCTLRQDLKLCPGDLGMDAASQTAIGAGNHVF